MTQATTIAASRWSREPRKFQVHHEEAGKPVWQVDGVYVSVDGDELSVRQTSANPSPELRIEVFNGELRIPLEDLVSQVLDRLEISELATMICSDAEARKGVIDALSSYYNEMSVEDEDRRRWLHGVKEAVHNRKLDELVTAMTTIERSVSQMGYRAMSDIHYDNVLAHALMDAGLERADSFRTAERYEPSKHLVDFKPYVDRIGYGGGDAWNDARDFWRAQITALFPVIAEDSE